MRSSRLSVNKDVIYRSLDAQGVGPYPCVTLITAKEVLGFSAITVSRFATGTGAVLCRGRTVTFLPLKGARSITTQGTEGGWKDMVSYQ